MITVSVDGPRGEWVRAFADWPTAQNYADDLLAGMGTDEARETAILIEEVK